MSYPVLRGVKLEHTGSTSSIDSKDKKDSKANDKDRKVSEVGSAAAQAVGAQTAAARAPQAPLPVQRIGSAKAATTVNPKAINNLSLTGLLDSLMDQVNAQIQKAIFAAESAANNLIIKAGRELIIAIENAKNAYKESLDYTVDKLDDKIKKYVNDLESLAQKLGEAAEDSLKELLATTQVLISTLPFVDTQTKLIKISPYYVVASNPKIPIKFIFDGIFNYSSTPNCKPCLEFSNSASVLTYVPSFNLSNRLIFSVPLQDLMNHGHVKVLDGSLPVIVGVLKAPWIDKSWVAWVTSYWDEIKASNFSIRLNILPNSPGKIGVEYKIKKTKIIPKSFTSNPTTCIGSGERLIPYSFPVDAGWKIVKETVKLHVSYQTTTDWSHTQEVQNDNIIVIGISNLKGTVGFSVTCSLFKEVDDITKIVKPVILAWGDSCLIDEPASGEEFSKITFEAFDGSKAEFGGVSNENQFLKVHSEGGRLKLKAIIPREII